MSRAPAACVVGTIRREAARGLFPSEAAALLTVVEDIENPDQLARLFDAVGPDVWSTASPSGGQRHGCDAVDPGLFSSAAAPVAPVAGFSGARLIQISSDGVFSGMRGGYTEDDPPDAADVYGLSKLLGEVRV